MHRALFGPFAALLVLASLTKVQAQEPAEIREHGFATSSVLFGTVLQPSSSTANMLSAKMNGAICPGGVY